MHPQRLEATGHVILANAGPDGSRHRSTGAVVQGRPAGQGAAAAPRAIADSPWTTPVAPPPARPARLRLVRPAQATAAARRRKSRSTSRARTVAGIRHPPRRSERARHSPLRRRTSTSTRIRSRRRNGRSTCAAATLELKHTADGNILTVERPIERPGEVHLPDLSLIGPHIVIDQVENVAEVQGVGSMTMISTTDFEGKKLAKPTPLTVTWKQGMRFTGKQAVFRGSVQADQENTTLLCQTMQVDLNRPVSLRQQAGDPRTGGAEPANVDKVICDAGPDRPQGVIITETIRENGRSWPEHPTD